MCIPHLLNSILVILMNKDATKKVSPVNGKMLNRSIQPYSVINRLILMLLQYFLVV